MGSRLQIFNIRDWTQGLNTAADESLLDPRELAIAENVLFDTSGSRKTRGGFKMWSYVATGVSRACSGKTRTLVVTINSGITITAGDYIAVWTDGGFKSHYDDKKVLVLSSVADGGNFIITYDLNENYSETTTADDTIRITKYLNEVIVGIKDFWYFSTGSKIQKRVAVTSGGKFYQLAQTGSMTPITDAGTALSGTITHCDFAVLGNKLIMAFNRTGNKPKIWTGTGDVRDIKNYDYDGVDVTSTFPAVDFEFMQVWEGRLWTNDKDDPDRLHYSDVQEPERMNGQGDSGAILIDPGDDDVSGISGILPPLKGRLPFAKRNKLFQVVGSPPLSSIPKISDGIGCAAHFGATAIDQDDIFFVSRKGFHSFSTTDQYGDFTGSFISNKIQRDFNDLVLNNMQEIRSAYIPELNSVIWAVNGSGASYNDRIYLYNVIPNQTAAWYMWTSGAEELDFASLELFDEANLKTLCVGTSGGLILKYDSDADYDLVRTLITMRIKSGLIYVDDNISTVKGFKRLNLLYKVEREDINFIVNFKIDNFDTQVKTVSRVTESDLLGTTFILGASELGSVKILVPDPLDIDGYGHGCSIEIISESQPLELYGYSIDWERSGEDPERSS